MGFYCVELQYLDKRDGTLHQIYFTDVGSSYMTAYDDVCPEKLRDIFAYNTRELVVFENRLDSTNLLDNDLLKSSHMLGGMEQAYGELTIINTDGVYDYLTDGNLIFSGMPYAILYGDEDIPYNRFSVLMVGIVERLQYDMRRIQVGLRDRMKLFDKPFDRLKYTGVVDNTNYAPTITTTSTTLLDGGVNNNLRDTKMPLLFGAVYNISPTLVNAERAIYHVCMNENAFVTFANASTATEPQYIHPIWPGYKTGVCSMNVFQGGVSLTDLSYTNAEDSKLGCFTYSAIGQLPQVNNNVTLDKKAIGGLQLFNLTVNPLKVDEKVNIGNVSVIAPDAIQPLYEKSVYANNLLTSYSLTHIVRSGTDVLYKYSNMQTAKEVNLWKRMNFGAPDTDEAISIDSVYSYVVAKTGVSTDNACRPVYILSKNASVYNSTNPTTIRAYKELIAILKTVMPTNDMFVGSPLVIEFLYTKTIRQTITGISEELPIEDLVSGTRVSPISTYNKLTNTLATITAPTTVTSMFMANSRLIVTDKLSTIYVLGSDNAFYALPTTIRGAVTAVSYDVRIGYCFFYDNGILLTTPSIDKGVTLKQALNSNINVYNLSIYSFTCAVNISYNNSTAVLALGALGLAYIIYFAAGSVSFATVKFMYGSGHYSYDSILGVFINDNKIYMYGNEFINYIDTYNIHAGECVVTKVYPVVNGISTYKFISHGVIDGLIYLGTDNSEIYTLSDGKIYPISVSSGTILTSIPVSLYSDGMFFTNAGHVVTFANRAFSAIKLEGISEIASVITISNITYMLAPIRQDTTLRVSMAPIYYPTNDDAPYIALAPTANNTILKPNFKVVNFFQVPDSSDWIGVVEDKLLNSTNAFVILSAGTWEYHRVAVVDTNGVPVPNLGKLLFVSKILNAAGETLYIAVFSTALRVFTSSNVFSTYTSLRTSALNIPAISSTDIHTVNLKNGILSIVTAISTTKVIYEISLSSIADASIVTRYKSSNLYESLKSNTWDVIGLADYYRDSFVSMNTTTPLSVTYTSTVVNKVEDSASISQIVLLASVKSDSLATELYNVQIPNMFLDSTNIWYCANTVFVGGSMYYNIRMRPICSYSTISNLYIAFAAQNSTTKQRLLCIMSMIPTVYASPQNLYTGMSSKYVAALDMIFDYTKFTNIVQIIDFVVVDGNIVAYVLLRDLGNASAPLYASIMTTVFSSVTVGNNTTTTSDTQEKYNIHIDNPTVVGPYTVNVKKRLYVIDGTVWLFTDSGDVFASRNSGVTFVRELLPFYYRNLEDQQYTMLQSVTDRDPNVVEAAIPMVKSVTITGAWSYLTTAQMQLPYVSNPTGTGDAMIDFTMAGCTARTTASLGTYPTIVSMDSYYSYYVFGDTNTYATNTVRNPLKSQQGSVTTNDNYTGVLQYPHIDIWNNDQNKYDPAKGVGVYIRTSINAGSITCDVNAPYFYNNFTASNNTRLSLKVILMQMLPSYTQLKTLSSLTSKATQAYLDTLPTWPVGVYIPSNSDPTVKETLDLLFQSVDSWYGFDRFGNFMCGPFKNTVDASASLYTVQQNEILSMSIAPALDFPKGLKKITVRYKKSYTQQSDGDLYGSANSKNDSVLWREWRKTGYAQYVIDRAIKTFPNGEKNPYFEPYLKDYFPLAEELVLDTVLSHRAHAAIVAKNVYQRVTQPVWKIEVEIVANKFLLDAIDLMRVVALNTSRFGICLQLPDGSYTPKHFYIIGYRLDYRRQKCRLSLWAPRKDV